MQKNTIQDEPDDLSKFAPRGNSVYGYQHANVSAGNVFANAPWLERCGGAVYFGDDIRKEDFSALMRIMEVHNHPTFEPSKHFGIYRANSTRSGRYGHIRQMRVIPRLALKYLFGALTEEEYETFPEQDISILDAFWSFIEQEREVWSASFEREVERFSEILFGQENSSLEREELGFGFMVENGYYGVYRIWSRVWISTK